MSKRAADSDAQDPAEKKRRHDALETLKQDKKDLKSLITFVNEEHRGLVQNNAEFVFVNFSDLTVCLDRQTRLYHIQAEYRVPTRQKYYGCSPDERGKPTHKKPFLATCNTLQALQQNPMIVELRDKANARREKKLKQQADLEARAQRRKQLQHQSAEVENAIWSKQVVCPICQAFVSLDYIHGHANTHVKQAHSDWMDAMTEEDRRIYLTLE